MTVADRTLSVAEAAAMIGTDPERLAARLAEPGRPSSPKRAAGPAHRRSSFNESWWIDDDGAWTNGRDRIEPSPETAAAWRAATARRRAVPNRGHGRRAAA